MSEFLNACALEELSARAMLEGLLPRLLSADVTVRYVVFKGRQDLERQLFFRLLEHDPNLSAGDADTENLLIQGDNLDALKALLPVYAGRVKCIFIDPPYNTGSAFEHYDDNLEHSQWLSLMYPRLELLREILSDDGSIWVCIDDDEAQYLKVVMDEVFGRKNFVAAVVWQKKYSVSNDHKTIAPMHDYVLVYRKSDLWQRNLMLRGNGSLENGGGGGECYSGAETHAPGTD